MNTISISPSNNISYKSRRKQGQYYSDLHKYTEQNDIIPRLSEILSDENCIGEGKNNRVYKLPDTDSFLFRAPKYVTPENVRQLSMPIEPIHDPFPQLNVGQYVAQCGKKLYFIVKQDGQEYSIPFLHHSNISPTDVDKYLTDVKKLSAMPQSSFDNFTGEVKELYKHNCYIDYFNSNNILLTESEINSVDIAHLRNPKLKLCIFPSKLSFMKMFTDEKALPLILPLISENQKSELNTEFVTISQKTSEAMRHANLPENNTIQNIVDFIADNFRKGKNSRFNKAFHCVV